MRGIEKRFYRRRDLIMDGDEDRTFGNGPNTIAALHHMARNIMQQEGSKGSLGENSTAQDRTKLACQASSHRPERQAPLGQTGLALDQHNG